MPRPIDLHRPSARPVCSAQGLHRLAGLLMLLSVLAGCSSLLPTPAEAPAPPVSEPEPAPPRVVPPPASEPAAPAPVAPPAPRIEPADQVARQVLVASERMRALGNAELVREVVRLSEGPAGPATSIEMALGLGLTRNPGDVARAIGLLDPIARSSSPDLAVWQPWARMLLARYQEQRRLEDLVERQGQQLREQQRRIDQLNNQVEALKAIERSMAPRPAAGPPASAPPRGTPP
jgi:hypothetical protein